MDEMEYNNNVTWLLIYKKCTSFDLKLMEVRKACKIWRQTTKNFGWHLLLVLDFSWQLADAPKQTWDDIFLPFSEFNSKGN